MAAELIHGMPFDQYLALDRLSSSGLKALSRSPAHYAYDRTAPRAPSPAQALGTHVHGLVLEPTTYRAAIAPEVDRRTKAGKIAWEEFMAHSGFHVVTQEHHDKALAMRDAVMAHPYARALIGSGKPEVTALWEDGGLPFKARFDWLCEEFPVILDLKTCQSADAVEFKWAAKRYAYDIQNAHYIEAARQCGLGDREFVFVAVENEPPHCVQLFTLNRYTLDLAEDRRLGAIERYRECVASGQFAGYPVEISEIGW